MPQKIKRSIENTLIKIHKETPDKSHRKTPSYASGVSFLIKLQNI